MATTASRSTTITLTGDVIATEILYAAGNPTSPGQLQITNLASGANTLTAPTSGTTPVALTIITPAGNATALTLKGVTGDTGVVMHLTDPTTIALAASFTSLCLTAGGAITGVRLIWN